MDGSTVKGENNLKPAETEGNPLQQRHLRIGWWTLCLSVTLGLVLEILHGLKVDWYVNVLNQSRRMMWTLAHTHGTLLGLLHLAFAVTLKMVPEKNPRTLRTISAGLLASTLLLPGGFFLGGIWIYDGDPGLGIWLVPPGGAVLVLALLLRAWKGRTKHYPGTGVQADDP